MARSPLYDSIVIEDSRRHLIGSPGASIQVLTRDTSTPVTVYDQETGGTGSTSPLVADDQGRFQGWVDPGQYTLRITPSGGSPTDVPLDISVSTAVIPDSLDLAPGVIEPIIDVTPKTTGMFFEFNQGVTGVGLSKYDPPQSNFYNTINNAAASLPTHSLTYDNTNLLSGLPGSVRLSSLGGTGDNYFVCNEPDFVETSDHYGTLYIRLDTANTQNIRPIQWLTESGSICGSIRITTAQKVAFLNKSSAVVTGTSSLGGAGVTASTTVLDVVSTPRWYRLEWHLDGTTSADVTIRIYLGHSSTILETLTFTAVDLRDARGTIWVGSTAGTALAGHDFQLAAVAEGGTDWFGPYGTAPRGIATRILGPDGDSLYEIHTDGSFVKRLDRTINHQPGGSTHYQHFRGAPVFKVDPVGSLMIGVNGNYRSSIDYQTNKLYDIFLNAQTGRVSASSLDVTLFNDPSDLAMSRKYPMYPSDRSGTGAATTNGSAVVTFSDLTLELLDVGRYCTINGTGCHIIALNGPNSCTMDVTFGSTASGLAWTAKEHPYPGDRTRGVTATGSHDGQIRCIMPYTPFIRESTIGTCTMTSANPGVVTKNAHHLVAGDPVVFTTTGTLPTNIVPGTIYYVISAGLTSNAFEVSATVGGAAIDTTAGAQAPTHTVKRPLANASGYPTISNMYGFTSADVGRALLFNGDFTLGEFTITAVDTVAHTVTVSKFSPGTGTSGAALSWALTGGQYDEEVSANYIPLTIVMGTAGGGARQWSSGNLYSSPMQVDFQMQTIDSDDAGVGVGLNDGGGVHTIMSVTGGTDSYGRGVLFGGHAHIMDAGKTLGYRPGEGVGAAVAQLTSKVTGVTINASSGRITSFNDNLNAGASATFTVTNSYVAADDVIVINVKSGRASTYQANVTAVATGSFDVRLQNYSAGNQADAVVMSFAIIKGAGTT